MKSKTFRLYGQKQKDYLISQIHLDPMDGSREWVWRDAQVSKSLQQLGVLFGLWIEEIVTQSGMAKGEVHEYFKQQFLPAIYVKEPIGPFKYEQQLWVDHLAALQQIGDSARFDAHVAGVRLKWASIKQMKEYLDQVYPWGIDNGFHLSVPDKFHKVYRPEVGV